MDRKNGGCATLIHPTEDKKVLNMNWIKIGTLDDIPRQGSRVVKTATGDIAVFRCIDDQIFALANRCPHKGGQLAQGLVHGQRVSCPLHNWLIDLATGSAVAPDVGCAPRYDVRLTDGEIWLNTACRA
jgi:nitrite reductase (NADH) small subunit